jgi:hypothetical protein
MTHRVTVASTQSFDICDEASVLSTAASVAYRATPARFPDTLISAIERPYRFRCLNDSSHHCGRDQYVGICDEASVLNSVASMTYRLIFGIPTTLTSATARSRHHGQRVNFRNLCLAWNDS